MPDSVPEMVSKLFSSLVPGIIQVPLQGLTSSVFAIVIVGGLNGFLWWFGIHPTVVNSIVNPLLIANADANQALFTSNNLSLSTGNVGTIQMIDQFATIGGAGMTIGLIIAMVIVAKSSRLKTMSKLAVVPACFNINEPLVFGLPIVFNPLMLIPVTIAPMVSVLIAYVAMSIGFMPLFTGVMAPWSTPPIISGFLVAGWQGAIVQILSIIVSVGIYYPFVKALDNQYHKEENVN